MANIRHFITEYERGCVQVTPSISYNLQDVINTSYRLYAGKFEEPVDSTGLKKIFVNMGLAIHRSLFYASDIDTKDLQMRAANANSIPVTYLLRMAVNHHLKVTGFSRFIDDVRHDMIAFGSSVVKIVNGKLYHVDLRNIVRPPHIADLQQSGIVERVFWTMDDVLAMNLNRSQKADVNALWAKMQKEGQNLFTGYEFWTYDDFDVTETNNGTTEELKKYTKGCIKYLDRELIRPEEDREAGEWSPFLELDRFVTPYKRKRQSKDMIAKLGEYELMFPYKQVDFMRPKGRWLGIGVFELIAGLQEYYNEKWHLYRKKDILDLRGIFKHKKGVTGSSLEQKWLDQLETGFTVELDQDEDIERLVVNMNTGEFLASIDKIYEIARQVVGVTAQGVGQDMPSTTTATVALANQKTQQTTYDYIIEQMSIFLVELFDELYFETIMDELTQKEMAQIVGSPAELEELDVYFVDNLIYSEAEKYKKTFGIYPTEDELDAERDRLLQEHAKMGDMRFAEIKKDIVKSAQYTIEFYVNNEKFDKGVQIQNIIRVLQDPNYTGSREKLNESLLDLLGLQGRNYRKSEKEKQEALLQSFLQARGEQQPGATGAPTGAVLPPGQEAGNAGSPGNKG